MIIKTFFALLSTSSLLTAYSVSVANNAVFGDPALPIRDNAGNPIVSGSIGVGYFVDDSRVTDNAQNFADLLGEFRAFGTTAQISQANAPGLIDIQTPAEFTLPVPFGTTGDQVGQNIFVVLGNENTLEGSDQLAVFRADIVFGTDEESGVTAVGVVNLQSDSGSLLLGNDTGANTVVAGANSVNYSNEIRLTAAVPEPSTGLLALFAGLGLVGRRRR